MMKSKESGYMFNIFPYKIYIVKKDQHKPARLNKADYDDGTALIEMLDNKMNIILFILLILLLCLVCYMLVPPTYGFFTH